MWKYKPKAFQTMSIVFLSLLGTSCIKAHIEAGADSAWQDTLTIPTVPMGVVNIPNFKATIPYSHTLDLSQLFSSLGDLGDVSGEIYLSSFTLQVQGNDLSYIEDIHMTLESQGNQSLPALEVFHYQKNQTGVTNPLIITAQVADNLYPYLSQGPIVLKATFTVSKPATNNNQLQLQTQIHFDVGLGIQKNL